jgi:hypothetical protein
MVKTLVVPWGFIVNNGKKQLETVRKSIIIKKIVYTRTVFELKTQVFKLPLIFLKQ